MNIFSGLKAEYKFHFTNLQFFFIFALRRYARFLFLLQKLCRNVFFVFAPTPSLKKKLK